MKEFLISFFNLLFPRTCAICRKRIGHKEECLCINCLISLPLYADRRFDDNDVMRRLPGTARIERASSVFYYFHGSELHKVIEKLKYGGRLDLALAMGRIMGDLMMERNFFESIDFIVPLPLHGNRQRRRGYNQARLIAEGLSERTRIPVADILERIKDNRSQTQLTAVQRMENVNGIFRIKNTSICKGKHILLIDDILTTGSTLMSAAKEIEGHAGKISILTLAATNG